MHDRADAADPLDHLDHLVENEIQDLFGVRFKGLAIDYERTLFLDEEVEDAPFCRKMASKNREEEPLKVTGPDG